MGLPYGGGVEVWGCLIRWGGLGGLPYMGLKLHYGMWGCL